MANENAEMPDFLNMPDDELREVDIDAMSRQANEASVDTDADTSDTDDTDTTDDSQTQDTDDSIGSTDSNEEDTSTDNDEDKTAAPAATDNAPAAGTPDPDNSKEGENTIDYKAAYERLTAPFKANGKDITVANVDDAISLMQMGANYNKKMAALKPNLKLLKTLENNGLLSQDKINYLIDLDKKNPDAINKLIKESGIDPLDISVDAGKDYVPAKHTVEDIELELDAVLDEIQDTPTYSRTLNVVSKEWDGPSKQVVANSPQLLKVINTHIQNGVYDVIQTEMENERMFGRLNGLSDIEAYRQVGDAIQARGGFNHLGHQGQQTPNSGVVTPKPKAVDSDKLKEKKRAASSTKPAVPTTANSEYNPLALSDAEFSKQINAKYL